MKKLYLLFFSGVISTRVFSQSLIPIKWDHKVNLLENCEAEIIFTTRVDEGWHLYSQKHVNGLPLVFELNVSDYYTTIGGTTEPEPYKEYDDVFKYDVFYFKESEVNFKQKIKISSNMPVSIVGKITGQVCKYETGVCVPLNYQFIFDISHQSQ